MNEFLNKLSHEFQTPFHNSVLIFSVILFIILLSPIILRRFKIPSIIGLIIAGVAIGPHGFFLIEKDSAVNLFSTIGLLYIMFIAGLELDLKEFAKNKYKSFVFGFLTFMLPLAIGLPVCMYLLGYSFNTSLLTASMFATHTLVAYPIVSRMGIQKNQAVAITVGGTILTDTAVLIILAVISASAQGVLTNEFWVRLGISIAVFLFVVVVVIPRFSAWFFRKLEGEKNSHFIFVLSVVFFCAFMAELAGLEPIIGAFAAGLSLNKLIPHTSSLMNRIEFVGNSLFIPFFLISVGMLIDVSVLTNGPQALIVAFTLTGVALGGKWLAAWASALILKYPPSFRNLIFGLSSAHAAATLAVILVGYRMNIIDENILNGTIILILFTCLVASFVTENAAKKVALAEETLDVDKVNGNEQKILVPISNPALMEKLVDFAITIKKPKNHFPVMCLSVVEDDASSQTKLIEAQKMLEKALTHAAAADQKAEVITTIDQNVPSGIKRVSKEMFATEVVVGFSQRKNWTDILFGKTMQNIVEQTHQTVFVCNLPLPLNIHRKIVLICPPYVEKEYGFDKWPGSVLLLAERLSLSCTLYATPNTRDAMQQYIAKNKFTAAVEYKEFSDWDDFLILSRDIEPNDLMMVILPRKGGVSFQSQQNSIPQKMAKHFTDYSFVLVHPEVNAHEEFSEFSTDYDGALIEKGMNQITQGAKSITKIFKRDADGEK